MNPDLLLIVPLVYWLYAIVRLAVDQMAIARDYAYLTREQPIIAQQLGQPVSMINAWQWMSCADPQWLAERAELTAPFRSIQRRLRAWNYRRFPIAVVLSVVFGTLREYLRP